MYMMYMMCDHVALKFLNFSKVSNSLVWIPMFMFISWIFFKITLLCSTEGHTGLEHREGEYVFQLLEKMMFWTVSSLMIIPHVVVQFKCVLTLAKDWHICTFNSLHCINNVERQQRAKTSLRRQQSHSHRAAQFTQQQLTAHFCFD